MRKLLLLALPLLLACPKQVTPVTAASEASPVPRGSGAVARVTVPHATGTGAAPHLGCQSGGCAYLPAPETKDLPAEQIASLMAAVAGDPVGTESLALDTLLFHDGEVQQALSTPAAAVLSPGWRAFLTHELSRRSAWFSLRVVDEQGRVRASLPETLMALGAKKHMDISESDLHQEMNANGTLIRVGVRSIWYRM